MPKDAFRISPADPTVRIADAIQYERIDIEYVDINHVSLTVGKKTLVVDAIRLGQEVHQVLSDGRRGHRW